MGDGCTVRSETAVLIALIGWQEEGLRHFPESAWVKHHLVAGSEAPGQRPIPATARKVSLHPARCNSDVRTSDLSSEMSGLRRLR